MDGGAAPWRHVDIALPRRQPLRRRRFVDHRDFFQVRGFNRRRYLFDARRLRGDCRLLGRRGD
jgi:hypothetical protein